MKKIILFSAIYFSGIFFTAAQNSLPLKKLFIFSAIKGTMSKPDSMMLPTTASSVKLSNGDTAGFKILSYKKQKLRIAFTPSADFIGITKAKLQVKNSSGKSIAVINLTGLSTKGLEGDNEPTLATVADALCVVVLQTACLPRLPASGCRWTSLKQERWCRSVS